MGYIHTLNFAIIVDLVHRVV